MPIMKTQNWLPDLFNDLFDDNWIVPQYKHASSTPAINVIERDNEYEVEVAAPGMTKDDFKVNLTPDNELVICLEKKCEKNDRECDKKDEKKEECNAKKHGQYLRHEFSYTSFRQSFTLPETVDTEKIGAQMEHGVLKINLPKKEVVKEVPTNRNIEIK